MVVLFGQFDWLFLSAEAWFIQNLYDYVHIIHVALFYVHPFEYFAFIVFFAQTTRIASTVYIFKIRVFKRAVQLEVELFTSILLQNVFYKSVFLLHSVLN